MIKATITGLGQRCEFSTEFVEFSRSLAFQWNRKCLKLIKDLKYLDDTFHGMGISSQSGILHLQLYRCC